MAPLVALAIGAAAAWWTQRPSGGTPAEAAAAGAVAGIGALLASLLVYTALGVALCNSPAVQEFVRSSEPGPESGFLYGWVTLLGAAAGALGGLGIGLVNLALATAGALLVARLRGQRPARILKELLG